MSAVVTDDQIRALRAHAAEHGDELQVISCERALAGDERDRAQCVRVILDARQAAGDISPVIVVDDITPERATVVAVRPLSFEPVLRDAPGRDALHRQPGQLALRLRDGERLPVVGDRIWLAQLSTTADSALRAAGEPINTCGYKAIQ